MIATILQQCPTLWHDNARVQICQVWEPQCAEGEETPSSRQAKVGGQGIYLLSQFHNNTSYAYYGLHDCAREYLIDGKNRMQYKLQRPRTSSSNYGHAQNVNGKKSTSGQTFILHISRETQIPAWTGIGRSTALRAQSLSSGSVNGVITWAPV
jgi:hypothetical protein